MVLPFEEIIRDLMGTEYGLDTYIKSQKLPFNNILHVINVDEDKMNPLRAYNVGEHNAEISITFNKIFIDVHKHPDFMLEENLRNAVVDYINMIIDALTDGDNNPELKRLINGILAQKVSEFKIKMN